MAKHTAEIIETVISTVMGKVLPSDVNKDWTCKDKDKDKDLTHKDQDKDKFGP